MIDCIDHVWRYCSRVQDDIDLAETGAVLRHSRGTGKPGRAARRPASIKKRGKKRRRSSSGGSARGSKKAKTVSFENDGRKYDTAGELDGYGGVSCNSLADMSAVQCWHGLFQLGLGWRHCAQAGVGRIRRSSEPLPRTRQAANGRLGQAATGTPGRPPLQQRCVQAQREELIRAGSVQRVRRESSHI